MDLTTPTHTVGVAAKVIQSIIIAHRSSTRSSWNKIIPGEQGFLSCIAFSVDEVICVPCQSHSCFVLYLFYALSLSLKQQINSFTARVLGGVW